MLKLQLILLVVHVGASVHMQQGWSVAAQDARIKREDEKFYNKLPKDERKRQRAIALYLSLPYGERLLDGWTPAFESKSAPKTLKLRTGVKIAGRWKRMQGKLGSAFRITPI